MIFRNQSESIGINRKMTGNDRNYERITTGNDRKRPQDLPRFCHFEEWIPRKFPDFPCIFLGNSPIFPDFL